MNNINITRRRLLGTTLATGSAIILGGCNRLDPLIQSGHTARTILESASSLSFRVQRWLSSGTSLAREYQRSDIRQQQHANGTISPRDVDYLDLATNQFSRYELKVNGLVDNELSLDLDTLKKLPARAQITRHDCVEGWSCIGEWTGVQLSTILEMAKPHPEARFAVFDCFDTMERGLSGSVKYYESIDMVDAMHSQTILAYGLNQKTLPVANGAPLRLRVERQLGYKHAKYVKSITLVATLKDIARGNGGYWEDRGYAWYAGI